MTPKHHWTYLDRLRKAQYLLIRLRSEYGFEIEGEVWDVAGEGDARYSGRLSYQNEKHRPAVIFDGQ